MRVSCEGDVRAYETGSDSTRAVHKETELFFFF